MSEIRAGRPNPDGAVHKLDTSNNCVLSFLRGEQVAIAGLWRRITAGTPFMGSPFNFCDGTPDLLDMVLPWPHLSLPCALVVPLLRQHV